MVAAAAVCSMSCTDCAGALVWWRVCAFRCGVQRRCTLGQTTKSVVSRSAQPIRPVTRQRSQCACSRVGIDRFRSCACDFDAVIRRIGPNASVSSAGVSAQQCCGHVRGGSSQRRGSCAPPLRRQRIRRRRGASAALRGRHADAHDQLHTARPGADVQITIRPFAVVDSHTHACDGARYGRRAAALSGRMLSN